MWLSSQNDQSMYWGAIQMVGIAFLGIIATACSDMSIHQLSQDNQDSLKKIIVADIGSREGQIYTVNCERSYISVAKRAKHFLNSKITTVLRPPYQCEERPLP